MRSAAYDQDSVHFGEGIVTPTRTARMGRAGNALVYLLPHETSYVEFLRLRKVAPLSEFKLY